MFGRTEKAEQGRLRGFKKGISGDDARRKREDDMFALRRKAREERIAKRRPDERGGGAMPSGASGPLVLGGRPQSEEVGRRLRIIPELLEGVSSDDVNRQYECTMQFRKLLSIERNPPIQEVIDCGVVPRLIEFLKFERKPQLQFEAAWALTNIASGTSAHTKVVMNCGAVPIFVQLLQSPNDDVREQAVWALGNIAGDSPDCRDQVLAAGALQPLLGLCTPQSKLTMLRNATWTLSNFCRGKPQPNFELVSPALSTLANLLFIKDEEVLTDACWALSYLSDDTGPHNEKIQAVIESGCCRRLVELLVSPKSNSVKTPALRTVGNIVTGDDLQTQVIINCGALDCLGALLENEKKGIRKEACWTISNITAGNPDQIDAVMKHNLIPPLVNLLRHAQFDIKKEAAWAISNATSGGNDPQIRFLVREGVIGPLCDLFLCADTKIVMVALEGIENILRVGAADAPRNPGKQNKYAEYVEAAGGLDKLEEIQQHENVEIYKKAVELVQTYFNGEEGGDEEIAPAVNEDGTFAFGAGAPQSGGFNF